MCLLQRCFEQCLRYNRHVEAVLEQHEGPVSSLPPLERLLRVMNDDAHIAISEVRVQQLRLITVLLVSARRCCVKRSLCKIHTAATRTSAKLYTYL
jgi:hypothetical protein